jgi:hypothetical protein
MPPTTLLNGLSETAIQMIKQIHREHLLTNKSVAGRPDTPISHPRIGRYADTVARREACLFRMVSVIEVYVDVMFELALRMHVPPASPRLETLLAQAALNSSKTWGARKQHALDLSLPIVKFGNWSQVDAAIEARNSIAHGLGSLSRIQRQAKDVAGKVKAIGITVIDNHLEFGPSTLDQVRDVLVEFVTYLDHDRGLVDSS